MPESVDRPAPERTRTSPSATRPASSSRPGTVPTAAGGGGGGGRRGPGGGGGGRRRAGRPARPPRGAGPGPDGGGGERRSPAHGPLRRRAVPPRGRRQT